MSRAMRPSAIAVARRARPAAGGQAPPRPANAIVRSSASSSSGNGESPGRAPSPPRGWSRPPTGAPRVGAVFGGGGGGGAAGRPRQQRGSAQGARVAHQLVGLGGPQAGHEQREPFEVFAGLEGEEFTAADGSAHDASAEEGGGDSVGSVRSGRRPVNAPDAPRPPAGASSRPPRSSR